VIVPDETKVITVLGTTYKDLQREVEDALRGVAPEQIGFPRCPAHADRLAICAFIGLAGRGMSAIVMRSAINAAS
jgi:hypothetical protein